MFEAILLSGLHVGRTGPAPWQAPKGARREDDGEEPQHTEREERPDKEEVPVCVRQATREANTLPAHVNVGDEYGSQSPEEDDDVPGAPFGEHQSSVQPYDSYRHNDEVH